ncbi:hypothetical protein Nmel_009638 [Mimus melanotis]
MISSFSKINNTSTVVLPHANDSASSSSTTSAVTVKSAIRRLKELKDQ